MGKVQSTGIIYMRGIKSNPEVGKIVDMWLIPKMRAETFEVSSLKRE